MLSTSRTGFNERLGFALLLMLLAWSPVPFGGNRPWAEAFMGSSIFGLLSLILIARIWNPQQVFLRLEVNQPVLWLFLGWIIWVFSQILLLPQQLVQWLSPHAYTIQKIVLTSDEWMSVSLDRDASLAMGLRISTVAALVVLIFLLVNSRRRLLAFALLLVVCGFLESIIGLGIYWSGVSDMTVPVDSRDTIGPVGTYISRNHFAGFLEMALAMNTGLILILYKTDSSGTGWQAWIRDVSGQILSVRGLLFTLQVVMFVALILSGSRGGVLALLIAGAIVSVVLGVRQGSVVFRSWLPIALSAGAAVLWFGGGAFLNRITALGLTSNRLDLAEVNLGIITDYPLTGSGAGTFRWVFPLYKDARFGGLFYEHAHNDYLEIASEQGVIGLVIFLGLVGLLMYRTYRGYCERHDRLARSVCMGALIGGFSLLAHSMIDFNLQIPANLYWFFAILAAGACAGQVERRGGV